MTDRELREAFRTPGDEDCPHDDTLWEAAHGRVSGEALSELLAHVRSCGDCADAWATALEARRALEDAPPSSVAEDYETPRPANRRWWWVVAIVAAVVAVAVIGSVVLRPEGDDPSWRGDADTVLTVSMADPVIRWPAGPEGSTYEIVLRDDALDEIVRASGTEPAIALPAGLKVGDELVLRVAVRAPKQAPQARTWRVVVVE